MDLPGRRNRMGELMALDRYDRAFRNVPDYTGEIVDLRNAGPTALEDYQKASAAWEIKHKRPHELLQWQITSAPPDVLKMRDERLKSEGLGGNLAVQAGYNDVTPAPMNMPLPQRPMFLPGAGP